MVQLMRRARKQGHIACRKPIPPSVLCRYADLIVELVWELHKLVITTPELIVYPSFRGRDVGPSSVSDTGLEVILLIFHLLSRTE